MSTRSATAIVAVLSALAFVDARAQNFIPRGPELNFVRPGTGVLTCSHDVVFTNAVLGNSLCAAAVGESPTSGGRGLFVDGRPSVGKDRLLDEALLEHPNNRDHWRNGRADEHANDHAGSRNGGAAGQPENQDDQPAGPAATAATVVTAVTVDSRNLPPVQLNPVFAAADVTSTPEPASVVLTATGLLGIAAYGRRRAKGRDGINN